ncbi:hypothetical protein DD549_14325 [Shewanella algae]|nr:hypothetical protein DD549_14325 [Shewanella algae]
MTDQHKIDVAAPPVVVPVPSIFQMSKYHTMMKENNKINTKGNWIMCPKCLRTNFDPTSPGATSSNRRIRKAMRDRGTKILDRFTWTVATSPDLDPLRTDNVLRALHLFTLIVSDNRYEGVIARLMPGFLHALTTDPVATANQIIDYQNASSND